MQLVATPFMQVLTSSKSDYQLICLDNDLMSMNLPSFDLKPRFPHISNMLLERCISPFIRRILDVGALNLKSERKIEGNLKILLA